MGVGGEWGWEGHTTDATRLNLLLPGSVHIVLFCNWSELEVAVSYRLEYYCYTLSNTRGICKHGYGIDGYEHAYNLFNIHVLIARWVAYIT